MDLLCFSFLLFAMPLCAYVYLFLVVTCGERADLLAPDCDVWLLVCRFPLVSWGQVWYLIVSIPDLCTFTYIVVNGWQAIIACILVAYTFDDIVCHFIKYCI